MTFLEKLSREDRGNLPYFLWFLSLSFSPLGPVLEREAYRQYIVHTESPASVSCTPWSRSTDVEYPLHNRGCVIAGVHETLGKSCSQPPLWSPCDSRLGQEIFVVGFSRKRVATSFHPLGGSSSALARSLQQFRCYLLIKPFGTLKPNA